MHKVLLVEDEMWVRLGLKNSIPWEELGMSVSADLANGQEAWEYYLEDKPDILITDIRMPEMDGMELIQRIRENDNSTKIIILTCLEEFELLQKAMRLGVSDFILKLTMNSNEMVTVLKKVKHELEEQMVDASKHMLQNMDVLKENLLKDYLFQTRYSYEEFQSYIQDYKLMLDLHKVQIGLMDIQHYHRLKQRFGDERGQLIRMSMLNVLKEILQDYGGGEVFHDNDNRYLFLLNSSSVSIKDQFEKKHQLLGHIRRVMRSYFNINVTFAVSGIASDMSQLRVMYRDCLLAMSYKLYVNADELISGDANLNEQAIEKIQVSLAVLADVLRGYGDHFSEEFSRWSERIQERSLPQSRENIVREFNFLLHRLSTLVPLQSQHNVEWITQYTLRLEFCETWDEMIQIAKEFIQGLMQAKQIPMSRKVSEAVAYMNKYFKGELTLQDVAEIVGTSPNYLSALFKKELNVNFSEYLIHMRIEKAKQLLLESDLLSYEVAERVGFMDHSHFSRTFKKSTGMGPREYRKRWGKGE
ncbi:hypothetical protein A8L34_00095 [Bacillus sp. FJAT-27264]|uniref:response regulator transcription factor n=1 Tax=Paenibacillus sp. (strain DSM 101736 / FJAT-27264) TaxID=1850362 RepID=UPI000807C4D0|nr:helix-turn-helix domain-containing protein [Bacillus sp. FJAT-27264]OBZ18031.1 hypothetical protein A8L34_00095 [Bacillus sp. FJAT-27264]